MRQAIVTKYLGPTNARGSRVKATAQAGTIAVPWDDARDVIENHEAAAKALAARYRWSTERMHGGAMPDDAGFVWVFVDV